MIRTVTLAVAACLTFGAPAVHGTAHAAEPQVELKSEIWSGAGQSLVSPTMRLRLNEESTVSVARNGVTVALTYKVQPAERALCHKISIGVRQTSGADTKSINTSAVTCGEQTVKVVHPLAAVAVQVITL